MNSTIKHIESIRRRKPFLRSTVLFTGIFLGGWLASITLLAWVNPNSAYGVASAQGEETEKRKTVRTPAMREKVYKKLASAQEAAEAKEYPKSMAILDELKKDPDLNCYEIAMTWTYIAYIYATQDKYKEALPAYINVLKQECVPEGLEQSTLFSIAQMYLATDQPREAIKYMKRWFAIATPNPQAYIMLGQCYFMVDDFKGVVREVEKAIALSKSQGGEPNEQWLLMLRAAYYELGNMAKVTEVLEELVRLYPKGQYFLQLSSVYGEQGKELLQTLTLESSYDGGYFSHEREYIALSSLLLNAEVPYKSAKVMEEGIKKKIVKEKINNLKILAQAWNLAQEPRESIRVLKKAAKISKDGELYVQLGLAYSGLDEWTACVGALRSGLKKGKLKRIGEAQFRLGVCLFNTDNLDGAIEVFKKAAKSENKQTAQTAQSWIDYLRDEKARRQALEAALI